MSSSDDSSSSSSDEGPVNERPSSHSGLSDDEPSSPQDKPPVIKKSPTPKNGTDSSESDSSNDDEDEESAKPKAKERSKSKSSSSSSESETEQPPAPAKPTDTIGSVSSDSSDEDKASPKKEDTPVVPDVSDSDDDGPKRKKILSPKESRDSDSDNGEPKRKKITSPKESRDSDSDNGEPKRKKITSPRDTVEGESDDDDIAGPRLHLEPEDMEEDEAEQPPIEYDVPLIQGNYGKEAPILTRWPNFLSVDQRPFNAETYDPDDVDITAVDGDGRSRLQLKVENCIRWRNKLDADGNIMKDDEGKEIKESNAKIVRWSDGSMTLNLGTEVYEMSEHKIEEYNQLFLRMRSGLHGNAVFKKRYTFRPATTDSLTHRKMTMQMAQKTNKSQKVKMIGDVGLDPESSRASLIRKEEERLRTNMRREAQQRKAKERQYRTGISHNFLEDRDYEDDPESLSAIKRSYKNNRFNQFDAITRRYAHSDEEEEDNDLGKIERSKIESDDEDDSPTQQKREEKKKRKIRISDEEDE